MDEATISLGEKQAVADFYQSQQNHAIMRQIVGMMKEIPELPSEVPTDINPLIKVEFPEAGGVLSYMGNFEHPYKGFPFFEFVDKIDFMKKTLRAIMSSFYHSIKNEKWRVLGLLLISGPLIKAFIYVFHRMVDRFKLKPKMYSDAIRELHRSFSVEYDEKPEEREMRLMLRDIVCMVLEMDNAYRFRFQDAIVELNQEVLLKRPIKEVVRVLTILSSRETTPEVRDTWTLVKYFLISQLVVNRKMKKMMVRVLRGLDLSKVALSVEDIEFCKKRKDYKFKFM